MTQYVALLRGIGPSNPNMHNNKLKNVFEDLGFQNVRTVLSSGNVLFESHLSEKTKIEDIIEQALPKQLDFKSTTIVQSRDDLQVLVDCDPFNGREDSSQCKLNVTFLKNKSNKTLKLPYYPANKYFAILGMNNNAICSIVNLERTRTPDLMRWMENEFGKNITTRTWRTVNRILKRLNDPSN